MGKYGSDSAHGTACWWILWCFPISFSADSQYKSANLGFSQDNPTSSADFQHWQILGLLPLNPAKILEEGEGHKGTVWTRDWFSPRECTISLSTNGTQLQSKHISEETSDRDHLSKAIHFPLFWVEKVLLLGWLQLSCQPTKFHQSPKESQSSPVTLASSEYLNKHLGGYRKI